VLAARPARFQCNFHGHYDSLKSVVWDSSQHVGHYPITTRLFE
jgi:hypothetical protein